jgi:hypothetical protein
MGITEVIFPFSSTFEYIIFKEELYCPIFMSFRILTSKNNVKKSPAPTIEL